MRIRSTIAVATAGALVCLGFTGAGVGVASAEPRDPMHAPHWIDDPYAPHDTSGNLLRVGTAVGGLRVDGRDYSSLGLMAALGRRLGRLSVDAEYIQLVLEQDRVSSVGRVHQLAAVGRFDVVRLGPHVVGRNSMIGVFAEAGVARTFYRYAAPGVDEAPRAVPADNSRSQLQVGGGLLLDHRLEQPLGFPSRIGWQLAWHLVTSRRTARDPMVSCRGCTAAPASGSGEVEAYDRALLVTSTLDFTW